MLGKTPYLVGRIAENFHYYRLTRYHMLRDSSIVPRSELQGKEPNEGGDLQCLLTAHLLRKS